MPSFSIFQWQEKVNRETMVKIGGETEVYSLKVEQQNHPISKKRVCCIEEQDQL